MADVGNGINRVIMDVYGEPATVTDNRLDVNTTGILVPEVYDYISLAYDGNGDLETVVYKTGGSGGTTVATLTLTYNTRVLATITRA